MSLQLIVDGANLGATAAPAAPVPLPPTGSVVGVDGEILSYVPLTNFLVQLIYQHFVTTFV